MLLSKLIATTSTLFRIGAWFFLRILPAKQAKVALPALYFFYLYLWTRIPYNLPVAELKQNGNGAKTNGRSNGNGNGKEKVVGANGNGEAASEKKLNGTTSSSTKSSHHVLPRPNLLRVLLSLPTSSKRINYISLAVNTLLMIFALDLLFTPMFFFANEDLAFSRIGAITPTSAKITVRLPPSAQLQPILTTPLDVLASSDPDFNELPLDHPILTEPIVLSTPPPARILYRQARPVGKWMNGPLLEPKEERDWVQTVVISGLEAGRGYEYILPPTPSNPKPSPLAFNTAPDPHLARSTGSHFTFLSTSCIKPNFPYSPNPFHARLRIPGVQVLANWLESPPPPSPHSSSKKREAPAFMTLLGDFVYVDTPVGGSGKDGDGVGWWGVPGRLGSWLGGNGNGNGAGGGKGWFRRLYRQTYGREEMQRVLEKLPMLHILDDHEITNNFAGEGNPSAQTPYPSAASAYEIYQGDANHDSPVEGVWWYDFEHGDTAFFVMDTRAERSNEWMVDSEEKTMLGLQQKEALFEWLGKVNDTATFKFIVSSVPFTSLWGKPDGQIDTWSGYRTERNEILDILEFVPNVIVLSGDRHESLAVSFRNNSVFEFSTSPLSQFYVPFVHTVHADLSRNYIPTGSHLEDEVLRGGEASAAATVGADGKGALGDGVPGTVVKGKQGELKGVPEEVILKYWPHGNVKWSSLEVDTRDRDSPKLNYELWIDGELAWHFDITGKPVRPPTTALGVPTVGGIKEMLSNFGLLPRKWF